MSDEENLPELSKAELDLMKILWRTGRSRAREVHSQLDASYEWAYSTTRTMLERMVGKGYLERETFHGVILYRPLLTKPQGLARLVKDFSQRVLEADPTTVVSLFANGSSLSADEVEELSDLVDSLEGEQT